jgi:hypothetical protein
MKFASPMTARSAATFIFMANAVTAVLGMSDSQAALAQSDPLEAATGYALADLMVPATAIGRADVSEGITTLTIQAQNYWASLDRSDDRSVLWGDMPLGLTQGAINATNFERLRTMALALRQPATPLYANASLAADIAGAMDFLVQRSFSAEAKLPAGDDPRDWEINAPKMLSECMALMANRLTAQQVGAYTRTIDHWVPNPTKPGISALSLHPTSREETGAELIAKASIVGLRGGVARSGDKLNLRIKQDTNSTTESSSDIAIASNPSSAVTTVGQVTINVDGVPLSWQSSSGVTWATFEKEIAQTSASHSPTIAVPLNKPMH